MEFESIEHLVKYVNVNLKKGESVAKLERALGLGKDTLRKRLNRANYKLDKDIKQFVLDNNIELTQEVITHRNTKTTLNKKENVLRANIELTQGFSDEEIKILKGIIKNYNNLEVERVGLQGKIITRSFRTYETVVDMFVKYCNDNKFSQKNAIAQAMLDFIGKEK